MKELKIQIFNSNGIQLPISQLSSELSPKLDLSIEGMRSQQFSEWIFVFLLLGILVFSGIVVALMYSKNRSKEIRLGERLMFAAIIFGLVLAVIIGAMQMLGGYLF